MLYTANDLTCIKCGKAIVKRKTNALQNKENSDGHYSINYIHVIKATYRMGDNSCEKTECSNWLCMLYGY